MEIYCTRPGCPRPLNQFSDLDDNVTLKTVSQKYCTACGMPLILDGRYLPERLLGKGGFGAAFLARDRRSPTMRQCAVKQFQPSADLNAQQLAIAQKLFETEALILDSLGNRHDQIPNLLAFFPLEAPGWPASVPAQFFYIVQEFIDGLDLEAELEQKGKFSEPEILELLLEILKILKFVHENEAIHRDIKPSNIMRDRSSGRLYLLDFGAVKQAGGAGGAASGKSTGIYSMGFAPPEQMAGRTVFPSTDLYALAVTCIMLLTGKQPQELFDAYSNEWNWRPHAPVSPKLADVLDRMLLPTPSDRYGGAEQVLAVLAPQPPKPPLPPPPVSAQPVSGQPVSPPPVSPPPVSPPPVSAQPTSPPTSLQPSPVSRQPTAPPPPSPGPIAPPSSLPKPGPPLPARPSFSTLEVLAGAAFTGFEGGLLAIALRSSISSPLVSAIIWALLLAALMWAQSIRAIAKQDLAIIGGISLAIVLVVAPLRTGFTAPEAILYSLLAGLAAIALTALFRLVYTFLSRIF